MKLLDFLTLRTYSNIRIYIDESLSLSLLSIYSCKCMQISLRMAFAAYFFDRFMWFLL